MTRPSTRSDDQLADAQRRRRRVGLAQRVAGRRVVDDLAMRHRRQAAGQQRRRHAGRAGPGCTATRRRSPTHMTTRARDGSRLNWRAGGIAHCRSSRLQQRDVAPAATAASRPTLGGNGAAGFERAQLLLELEREVEGQQVELASRRSRRPCWPRTAGSRGPTGTIATDFAMPVHRRDVGELRPVRVRPARSGARCRAGPDGSRTDWRAPAAAPARRCARAWPRSRRRGSALRCRLRLARVRVDAMRVEPGVAAAPASSSGTTTRARARSTAGSGGSARSRGAGRRARCACRPRARAGACRRSTAPARASARPSRPRAAARSAGAARRAPCARAAATAASRRPSRSRRAPCAANRSSRRDWSPRARRPSAARRRPDRARPISREPRRDLRDAASRADGRAARRSSAA